MDASERRRRFLRQMSPWIGFLVGAVALSLGLQAIAAGYADSSLVGYVVGALELGAGYVTVRRAWKGTIDAVFVGGIAAVVVLSVFVLTQLQPPPTVFERVS